MLQFDSAAFETITTTARLSAWIKRLECQKSFAFDTETTGLDVFQDSLVGIAVSCVEGDDVPSAYIPVGHHHGKQLPVDVVIDALRPVLRNSKIGKVFHNAEYDLNILRQSRYAVEVNNIHDTKWMAYTLTANTTPLDMDFLSMKYMGHKTIKFADVVANRPGRADFRDVPLDEATHYAAEDTAVTLIMAHGFMSMLKATGRLWEVYTRDRKLIPVLVDMKQAGCRVDVAHLRRLEGPWQKETDRLRDEITKAAGEDFNPGSAQQLLEVLLRRGLAIPEDKDGKQSVSKDVLKDFEGDAVVDAVLAWKGKAKLLSTYVRALPKKVKPHDGNVHGGFNFCGPITGRASSSDPNLQNIPTRTKDGEAIREAFTTRETGNVLLSADYSQIEYRVLAHITQSPYLVHCFQNGIDLHAKMAADVRGGDWTEYANKSDKAKGKVRGAFKNVNFAVIYGAGPPKIARMSDIDVPEAYDLLDAHREMAPEVYAWKEDVWDFAREHQYVETLFGRRVPLPYSNSRNSELRGHAERLAVNAVIQGSAADLLRLAMYRVHNDFGRTTPNARPLLLLTVHDELVVECMKAMAEAVATRVKHCMEVAADDLISWRVPIIAEVGIGRTWKEAKG